MPSYDELDAGQQALARARWSVEIPRAAQELDLASEFKATGLSYSELDEAGRIVTHRGRTGEGSG